MRPLVGVSLIPQRGFHAALSSLLAEGAVEAVEWTIDLGFGGTPAFVDAMLAAFGPAGRAWAHGFGYSPLSAGPADESWLRAAADAVRGRGFRHLTEHFGFCTGGEAGGAPLPMPAHPAVVEVGVRRLRRLRDAVGLPVGLENLALGFSRDDALAQGELIDAVLDPVDGVLHLDLHNLWTQAVNFDLDPVDLLDRYPLARARVVHVSGGSWVDGVRRDTHDDRVPDEVLSLLRAALPRLPALEAVLVERIGTAFAGPGDVDAFVRDVRRTRAVVVGAPDGG